MPDHYARMYTMEIWKAIPGYEGLYEASSEGRVKSLIRNKVMLLGVTNCGYAKVALYTNKKYRTFSVHRLIALAFLGPVPARHVVNHKSGVKLDNSVLNLEYCTVSKNMKHAYDTGLNTPANGETHCRAKLKKENIAEIIAKANAGEKLVSIAKRFSVNPSQISRIVSGVRWRRTTAGAPNLGG